MTSEKNIRTRIAPSPTGNLHVGTARTALYDELFARHNGGKFIVRIEDTDKARSKPEFEQNILEGMKWLGITWDEGPDIGGPYAPYRQSERGHIYQEATEKLLQSGHAFYCFCPPRSEQPLTTPHCTCADISLDEAKQRIATEKAVIRLKVEPQTITFTDAVRGEVSSHTDTFGGDFVIAKSVTEPLYHLAVVVDDAHMEITHVIRGEDHISNTPKHILIQKALGYSQPEYAHLPLLLDKNRAKLSKRKNETSLLSYRDLGYLPEAMQTFLALLGWNPKTDQEMFTRTELIDAFSLDGVQPSGAIFSLEKLQAINKIYIRKLDKEALFAMATPFLEKAGVDTTANQNFLKQALVTEQERVATLAEFPQAIAFFLPTWQATYDPTLLVWRKSTSEQTKVLLQKTVEKMSAIEEEHFIVDTLQAELMAWIDAEDLGRGDTLWPLRVALTGQEHSPGPFEVAAVLGKTVSLQRLNQALSLLT